MYRAKYQSRKTIDSYVNAILKKNAALEAAGGKNCSKCEQFRAIQLFPMRKRKHGESYHSQCKPCLDAAAFRNRKRAALENAKFRVLIITKLGGMCRCCGEKLWEFLQIDHVNGDGNNHRKKAGSGKKYLQGILDSGPDPTLYRVLCANCNASAYRGDGVCVHQRLP